MAAAPVETREKSKTFDYDYSNFYYSSGDDIFAILEPYDQWWAEAKPAGYYLYSQPIDARPSPRVAIAESQRSRRELLNLSSYNYLGLSYRPEVIAAAKRALDRFGVGAAGSPILSGTMSVHRELEAALATYKRKEAALIFPTGYSTNVGVIQGIMRPGDWIIADQNAHASIVDGAILSKANVRFFRHNKPEDLDRKLSQVSGRKLVAVEGLYSMDGDICPLPEIVQVCRAHGARLLLDEAHSGFVYGATGRGVAEHFDLENDVDIHVGTFSKALGGQGGYIAASKHLCQYLLGFARSRFFSCSLSPVVAAGVLEALRIAQEEPQLRDHLWDNVRYLRGKLAEHDIDVGDSESQIVTVMVRNDARILPIAHRMQEEGLFLQPIVYPAVSKNKSRFRISLSASHTRENLDEAAATIARVLREAGIV